MEDRYLSAEARAFLQQTVEPLPPFTPERAALYREAAEAEFLPRANRAVAKHGVEVNEIEIAGVPCLEILPPNREEGRTLFYGYGGGYISGSAREDLIVSVPLGVHARARVVAVDYRRAPEHPWPAAPDDAEAVYRVLCAGPGKLAVAGESAGGNLMLVTLRRAQAAGLPMPCAAALLSPWCDLTHGGDSLAANDGRDPTLPFGYVDGAAKAYAGEAARDDPDISPLLGRFGPWFPPALITTGTRDLLLSPSVELARRLRAAGADVDLRIWDGLWHVFEFYDELPEAAESLAQAGAFLDRRFTS